MTAPRPEVVDLLGRLDDPGAFALAVRSGQLGGLTAVGRLLEREERELLGSVSLAELEAFSSQRQAVAEMNGEVAGLLRELADLMPKDKTLSEAVAQMEPEEAARVNALVERIGVLELLLDPQAKTNQELAAAYMAGRLIVAEWCEDGRPRCYADAEPDPTRPVPPLSEVAEVLVSLVGETAVGEHIGSAPVAWRDQWVDEEVRRHFEALLDDGDGAQP